jgi:hypothetical protein
MRHDFSSRAHVGLRLGEQDEPLGVRVWMVRQMNRMCCSYIRADGVLFF